MYIRLKRIIVVLTMIFITTIGIIFIKSYENEMFSGYKEVIIVEKTTLDFEDYLNRLVYEKGIVLAKRIVDSDYNKSGKLKNTYIPIGGDYLPKNFPLQTDQSIIEASPDNTLYVITKGNSTAQSIVKELNEKGNSARVFSTNYEFTLLRLMLTTPQSLMVIFAVLIAYSSLILAEHISSIKEVGIRRISGEGKHQIAAKQTNSDSIFLGLIIIVTLVALIIALELFQIFSFLALFIITMPILFWSFLLLVLNFCLSNLFYYILQHQPIFLSIKGKAPMRMIFVVVIITQMFTLFSVMYSILGVVNISEKLETLHRGEREWKKFPNFYEITSLDDGDSITSEQKAKFYKELNENVTIIYRADMLDNIAISRNKKTIYSPTADLISNVIYVNENYLKENNFKLSKEVSSYVEQMGVYDKCILIPESQQKHFQKLSKEWKKFETQGFLPDDAEFKNPHPEARISSFLYEGGELFSFPVFSQIGQISSIEYEIKNPIIIIEKPLYENLPTSQLLVNNAEIVTGLIKKNQLTAGFGSLTNGQYAAKQKIIEINNKKFLVISSAILSIISSILLHILLNKIYFYQGRKLFFIERLAGKSLLGIHKTYLGVLYVAYLVIFVSSCLLKYTVVVSAVPLFYLWLLLAIFIIQLKIERNANVLYLKGE
ncbi:MAG: DUF1430 domain-containing protein [Streptococcus sp.]|nr:DUF1430 domain-containing protein [Streptococcus sp.]